MKKKASVKKQGGFRLIPITVTMLTLLFAMKVNDLYIGSRQLREFYGIRDAAAEAPKETKKETPKKESTDDSKEAKPEDHGDTKAVDPTAETPEDKSAADKKDANDPNNPQTFGTGKSKVKDIEAMKAREAIPRFTQNEVDLLQNLSKRREELDQREKDLDLKMRVLDASEKQINNKISEMKTLQTELQKVLTMYDEKQNTQIKSLVKIYENMKPGDAANIFNEMQMAILLEVIDKMSERKVAPVLAAMDPKKARDVTQELAAMRKSITEKSSGAAGSAPGAAPKP